MLWLGIALTIVAGIAVWAKAHASIIALDLWASQRALKNMQKRIEELEVKMESTQAVLRDVMVYDVKQRWKLSPWGVGPKGELPRILVQTSSSPVAAGEAE